MRSLELPESDEEDVTQEDAEWVYLQDCGRVRHNYTPGDIRAIDDENILSQLKDGHVSFPASKLVRACSLRSHVISYFALPLQTLIPSASL